MLACAYSHKQNVNLLGIVTVGTVKYGVLPELASNNALYELAHGPVDCDVGAFVDAIKLPNFPVTSPRKSPLLNG
jgi:hypothetical protein